MPKKSKKTKSKNIENQKTPINTISETSINISSSDNEWKKKIEKENELLKKEIKYYEEEIKAEKEKVKQEILSKEEEILNEKRKEEEEFIKEIKTDAQKKASEIIDEANSNARSILETAENEKRRIHCEAKKEKFAIIENAKAEAKKNFQETILEIEKSRQDLDIEHKQLQKREKQIKIIEEDLKQESEFLKESKNRFDSLYKECSPARIKELETLLEIRSNELEILNTFIDELKQENNNLKNVNYRYSVYPPDEIIANLKFFKEKNKELEDELAQFPLLEEIEHLKFCEQEVEELKEKNRILRAKLSATESRAMRLDIGCREIEQNQLQIEALKKLNDQLKNEINYHINKLETETGERFPELVNIDKELKDKEVYPKNHEFTLKEIVEHVKNYAANQDIPLFYEEKDIRAFLAGMAISRLTILQGLSGTGKTSFPRVFAEAIGGKCDFVPVHSNWRDRHELLGYNNDFMKKFTETDFTKFVYTASYPKNEDIIWFIVLDEMNLARIEYYFADFLSVLEQPDRDKWLVSLISHNPNTLSEGPLNLHKNTHLKVSQNLWFVGTANKDESTFEITDKVYDRAQVIEFPKKQNKKNHVSSLKSLNISRSALENKFEQAITENNAYKKLNDEENNFIELIDLGLSELEITFGNRIEKQIERFVPVFVACGGNKSEAIDYILARKVFRKIDNLYDASYKDLLKDIKKTIKNKCREIGWNPMDMSEEVLEKKIKQFGGDIE